MVARPDLFLNRREAAKLADLSEDEMAELIRLHSFPKPDFIIFNSQPRWRRSSILQWKMQRRVRLTEDVT